MARCKTALADDLASRHGDTVDRVLSGLVLAAGRSRRMGTDKALLSFGGRPLWQRQRDLLRDAGAAELLLSVRPDQAWAESADGFDARLHDALPDCGPIVGVCAALERMTGTHLAAVAIDLPRLPARWFQRLVSRGESGVGVVGQRGDYFEPLAAVYPRELKCLAWEQIARGDYSLQSLIKTAVETGAMLPVPIAPDEASWFENWNEP